MRAIQVTDRQNMVDIATQYYGSAAGVIDLCVDNGWDLDHDIQPGDMVLLQDEYPASADPDIADYLQGNEVVVVSISEQGSEVALGTNNNEFIITNDDNYLG